MGSISFVNTGKGLTMGDTFDELQRQAEEEYGSDVYNGKINNSQGFFNATKKFKESKLSLNNFIDRELGKMGKHEYCLGVCIKEPVPSKLKVKTKVDNIPQKGTAKWKLLYEAAPLFFTFESAERYIKSFDTKKEAIDYARSIIEKTKFDFEITVKKELVGRSSRVARVSYKQDKNEKLGEYVFFGHVNF